LLKSVLVVGAHPDDETMLLGGTIALLTSMGIAVHLVCATRGEGGEQGEPPLASRADLGALRERELRCAAAALGIATVTVLGYVDPLVGPDDELYPFEADFLTLTGQIRSVIRQVGADLVLSHGSDGEYGHPAHRLMHRATLYAVQASAHPPILYTFAAFVPGIEDHIWNETEPAHLALDVRPWLDVKEAAALCHVSQHALFKRHHNQATIREALRTTESFHRYLPEIDGGCPQDPFADLLRAAGAWMPALPGV
jgi:LmbE family N-acetylglucosaminyl deacetylase